MAIKKTFEQVFGDILAVETTDPVYAEKQLLLNILARACLDATTRRFSGWTRKRDQDEARDWIFTKQPPGKFREFSLDWLCEHLDRDSQAIRASVQSLIDEGCQLRRPRANQHPRK